jgi:hypothetical protein
MWTVMEVIIGDTIGLIFLESVVGEGIGFSQKDNLRFSSDAITFLIA